VWEREGRGRSKGREGEEDGKGLKWGKEGKGWGWKGDGILKGRGGREGKGVRGGERSEVKTTGLLKLLKRPPFMNSYNRTTRIAYTAALRGLHPVKQTDKIGILYI
jgi:hypothetical protein